MAMAINIAVFVLACALAWYPGNWLIWFSWKRFAWYASRFGKVPIGEPRQLARTIGGLERILYIFSVMVGHLEILAGWLIMKAFFGWIKDGNSEPSAADEPMVNYYGFLQGNLSSLLLGLGVGEGAKATSDWLLCRFG